MPTAPTTQRRVYDAILLTSFGGPEGPDDVIPFLENVLRGKPVPRERLLEVAEHYQGFGGVSPINGQCRELIAALKPALADAGIDLPVYWGNRNWEPMLPDTVAEDDAKTASPGRWRWSPARTAVTPAAGSTARTCTTPGNRGRRLPRRRTNGRTSATTLPATIDKVRVWYNHPEWIAVNADLVRKALDDLPAAVRDSAHVAFTAHSIPMSMADTSDYAAPTARNQPVDRRGTVGVPEERWALVYQSRSGRPQDPWLEPDVCDHLEALSAAGVKAAVVAPIGFVSDHMEVLYDLDEEAKEKAEELEMQYRRAGTAGTHPRFVSMLVELIRDRLGEAPEKRAVGQFRPNHDVCPKNCCPNPYRPSPV